jgi:hypothetical protein
MMSIYFTQYVTVSIHTKSHVVKDNLERADTPLRSKESEGNVTLSSE